MKLIAFIFSLCMFSFPVWAGSEILKSISAADLLLSPDMKLENGRFGEWWLMGKPSTVEVSARQSQSAKPAIHLKDLCREKSNEGLTYSLPPDALSAVKGKVFRFSAWIKKISGDSGVGIGVWSRRADGTMDSKSENVQIKGESDWFQYTVSLPVSEDALSLSISLNCANGWGNSGAEAYFNDFSLDYVDRPQDKLTSSLENSFYRLSDKETRFYLFRNQVLPNWSLQAEGAIGFELTENASESGFGKGVRLSVLRTQDRAKAGFSLYTDGSWPVIVRNRRLDLSEFLRDDGYLSFKIKPFTKIYVAGIDAEKFIFGKENGWTECRIPLKILAEKLNLSSLDRIEFQIAGLAKGDSLCFDSIVFAAPGKLSQPPFVFKNKAEEAEIAALSAYGEALPEDKNSRPEIKNGIFFYKGEPSFLMGPWISDSSMASDFSPESYRNCGRAFYNQVFDRPIAEELGFSSAQISSAPIIPVQYAMKMPVARIDTLTTQPAFYRGLHGMPVVLDFAWINNISKWLREDPDLPKEIFKQPYWQFFPFCPESPEGMKIYKEYMKRGAYFVLKNGGNPYVYELFNEDRYECRCDYNKKSFMSLIKKNYGDIESANKIWGSKFKSFEDAVYTKGNYESFSGLWADWCKFQGSRYAAVLTELKDTLLEVDKRKNVYFTEQIALSNISEFGGAGMDYRKIADALDLLALEGGFRFGTPVRRENVNEMLEVVNTGRYHYHMAADLFTALAKARKPVLNDEHYCMRYNHLGKRVPSKKEDIITAMWGEVFHGVSGSYMYAWERRSWEWKSLEDAKNLILNGGPNDSYKGANLLNPYNYPLEALDGFRQFRNELASLKKIVMPVPRLKPAKVAYVHSYPTLRLSSVTAPFINNSRILELWYGALLCTNYSFEALFEEDFSPERLSQYNVLVIPCMKNSYSDSLPLLRNFVRKGGIVICGYASFMQDEYGKTLEASDFLGLERKSLDMPVREDEALRMENFISKSAKIYLPLKSGKTLVSVNSFGDGKVYSFSGELPEKELKNIISRIMTEEKIPRYLEPVPEDGEPLDSLETQIIDRGDVKLIFMVNWESTGTRLVRLKIPDMPEGLSLADPVAAVQYTDASGNTEWSSAGLASGVLICLPPQTRQLLLLRKNAPVLFQKRLSASESARVYESLHRSELSFLEAMGREASAKASAEKEKFEKARKFEKVDLEKCVPLDLKNYVNMAFRDDLDGDRKGGWFDQGQNDFRNMPLGKQILANVPFSIIDPESNNDKSCIVLRGRERPYFPVSVDGIPVNSTARKIYFLHTGGWGAAVGSICFSYLIHYEDGSSLTVPVEYGVKVGGWWHPEPISEGKIALDSSSAVCKHIGLYAYCWENPFPDRKILGLDVNSAGTDLVPAIIAITLEK